MHSHSGTFRIVVMMPICSNHEIIDTLKKEGWTFEEVIKSVYYFWKYIVVNDHTWTINPSDLIDHLRNTVIDYDSSYVSICQNGEKVDVNMKSMVGKNNAKMMNSPAIWKIQKNIDGYWKLAMKMLNECYGGIDLREMLEDYIIECNLSIGELSSGRFAPKSLRFALNEEEHNTSSFLDKEIQSYINVLTMFELYDCMSIKSIYNLGNNSFIIEINNDTNDQVMHLQLKDRTINEWVSNGDHNGNLTIKKTDQNTDSYQISELLLKDTVKALVKLGLKSLAELKRITIINNNRFTLILENGSMYNVIRGKHCINVIEFVEKMCDFVTYSDCNSD